MEEESKIEHASQVEQDAQVERDLDEAEEDSLIEQDSKVNIPFVLAEDLKKLGFKSNGLDVNPQSKHPSPCDWPRNRLYEGFELEKGTDTTIKVLHDIKQRYWRPTFSHRKHQKRHNPGTITMIYNTLFVKTNGLLCYLSAGELPNGGKSVPILLLGHPCTRPHGAEQKASEEQKKIVAEMLGKDVSDIKEWQISAC